GVEVKTGQTSAVSFFTSAEVSAAFSKGSVLLETSRYRIIASNRTGPGEVEVHARETDVIYVVQGAANIVTGGTVIDGRSISANEIRGARIEGGESRRLAAGDVMVIPAGTPHWFESVQTPLLYFTVKPVASAGE